MIKNQKYISLFFIGCCMLFSMFWTFGQAASITTNFEYNMGNSGYIIYSTTTSTNGSGSLVSTKVYEKLVFTKIEKKNSTACEITYSRYSNKTNSPNYKTLDDWNVSETKVFIQLNTDVSLVKNPGILPKDVLINQIYTTQAVYDATIKPFAGVSGTLTYNQSVITNTEKSSAIDFDIAYTVANMPTQMNYTQNIGYNTENFMESNTFEILITTVIPGGKIITLTNSQSTLVDSEKGTQGFTIDGYPMVTLLCGIVFLGLMSTILKTRKMKNL